MSWWRIFDVALAAAAMNRLYINGRYLTQTLSGVQRFATEITAELLRQRPDRVALLGPPGADRKQPAAHVVGRGAGQRWEQMELPRHAGGGLLINLGNTGPLSLRSQIVVIHDAGVFATPDAYSWKFRLWYKLMQGALVRRGARIVTVSEFGRGELARHLRLDRSAIGVISEGADHLKRIAADPGVLRRLPPGPFVLVVGNLAAHKNLSALSVLAPKLAGRGISLVITGGLAAGAFQDFAVKSLPQPACMIGRVSDGELKALYEAAACLVFPSRYEGFGLPAVEAMACGCPLAVSRIAALQEVCGEVAVYFDPRSPDEIAAQVCSLLDDPPRLSALKSTGLQRAATFTWSGAAGQLLELCEQI